MTTPEQYIKNRIAVFTNNPKLSDCKTQTLLDYADMLFRDLKWLRDNGYQSTPSKISHDEIRALLTEHWTDSPKYNYNRHSLFFRFLTFYKNTIVEEYPSPKRGNKRIHVDWLSDEEAIAMYNACINPIEKWVIHAELRLLLRRFDMLNIRVEDVKQRHINVLGKGDKWRIVPFVSDTEQVLHDLAVLRKEQIRGIDNVPDKLLVYRKYKNKPKVSDYKETATDNIVKRVARRAGILRPISNHTLRRTGARMWYRSGVLIATLSLVLGHSDEKTTIRYLGLEYDDVQSGADVYDKYFENQREKFSNSKKPEIQSKKITSQKERVDWARFELATSCLQSKRSSS